MDICDNGKKVTTVEGDKVDKDIQKELKKMGMRLNEA